MSNEVNISEIGFGTLDPGVGLEIYNWTSSEAEYNERRRKVRFFTIAPDPLIPIGDVGTIEFVPGVSEMEITRIWSTVWTGVNDDHAYQWNVAVRNVGQQTTAWHLLQAETDN